MIGDTEYDLAMAANAGVRSVAVTYGVHACERLLEFRPLGCIDSLSELPGLLARHGLCSGSEPSPTHGETP
jgi:phosphoglycolate phosphatase